MRFNKTLIAIASLTLLSSAAFAATSESVEHDRPLAGPYLGLAIGYGAITNNNAIHNLGFAKNVNNGGFAWDVKGGFLFKTGIRNLAAGPEVSYTGYPNSTVNFSNGQKVKIEAGSMDIVGVAKYAVDDWVFAGKFGVGVGFYSAGNNSAGNNFASNNSVLPEFGLGVGYNFGDLIGAEGLDLTADFKYLVGNNSNAPSLWAVLFGFTYNFANSLS